MKYLERYCTWVCAVLLLLNLSLPALGQGEKAEPLLDTGPLRKVSNSKILRATLPTLSSWVLQSRTVN